MTTQLLIARHGNTFDAEDVILRVGARTDLPLSQSGQAQARALGAYLAQHYPDIAAVYVSELKRTQETAALAVPQLAPIITPMLNEMDYGPDEGQPETQVIARLGQPALDAWETNAIPPTDWQIDPQATIKSWHNFANNITQHYARKTVLAVTSNGIARFALPLCEKVASTPQKLRTGALGILTHHGADWQLKGWDFRT